MDRFKWGALHEEVSCSKAKENQLSEQNRNVTFEDKIRMSSHMLNYSAQSFDFILVWNGNYGTAGSPADFTPFEVKSVIELELKSAALLWAKNWLFSGNPRGAEVSALFYSLNATAKATDSILLTTSKPFSKHPFLSF